MIKLFAALAEARDSVDYNIAFGEAVPQLERAKTFLLLATTVVSLMLAVGFLHLSNEVNSTQAQLARILNEQAAASEAYRVKVLKRLEAIAGQRRASAPAQS